MVKLQLKNTLKTYCKKKVNKKKGSTPIIINSVTNNVFQITVNQYFECKSSSGEGCDKAFKESTYHSESSSKSGDEFDRLFKGLKNIKSTTSRSPRNKQFFQRQERSTFYHSNVSSEASRSVHLFKDTFMGSDSSDFHSTSHIPTPPSYRLQNKKLIKVVSQTHKNIKTFKGKCKRLNKSLRAKKLLGAASSTPTRPNLVLSKPDWMGLNDSPILPPPKMPFMPSPPQNQLMVQRNKNVQTRIPFDISALTEGLGRLGIGSNSTQTVAITELKDDLELSPVIPIDPPKTPECKTDHNSMKNNEIRESSVENKSSDSLWETNKTDSPMKNNRYWLEINENKDVVNSRFSLQTSVPESPIENKSSDSLLETNKTDSPMKNNRYWLEINENKDVVNSRFSLQTSVPESPIENKNCNRSAKTTENDGQKMKNIEWQETKGDDVMTTRKSSVQPGVLKSPTENNHCDRSAKTKEVDRQININRDWLENEEYSNMIKSKFSVQAAVSGNPTQNRNCENSVINTKDNNQIQKNRDWLETEGDISIIKPRLSLRPGKQWKRSLLQQKFEENKKSSFSSCVTNRRRSTIGPALLAKLVGSASQNMSAPNLSQTVNEALEETLPILRLNAAALDTITKRKRHKTLQRLDIVEEEDFEQSFTFNQSYGSFRDNGHRRSVDLFQEEENGYSLDEDKLLCSGVENLPSINLDQHSRLISQGERALGVSAEDVEECLKENIKLGALARCGQEYPLPFSEIFTDNILDNCKKIGEGVFGEVFMLRRSSHEVSVLKVIPVEGTQLVNNEPQKCLDEVLSEIIIAEELSLLRNSPNNCTSGFCELKDKFCLQGTYPSKLVQLWKKFAEEDRSENDCPDMFGSDQLYVALELDHAGQPIENFKFDTAKQALSVLLQTTFSLGAAELSLEFEHRDLHIGNVLIKDTSEEYVSFIHDGYSFQLPTYGIKATIIDFTLSRISYEEDVLFCDLEKDPELFTAEGDYQFEIYRLMRNDLKNNWRTYAPITNIRWLDYLADKLINKKKYKRNRSTVHKECMKKLIKLKEIILDFRSSSDLTEYLLESYKETIDIIRMY